MTKPKQLQRQEYPEVVIDYMLELRKRLGHDNIVELRKVARELRKIGCNAFPVALLHKISFFLNLRSVESSIDIRELAKKEHLSGRTIYRYLNEYFNNDKLINYLAQQEQAILNKSNPERYNNESNQAKRCQSQRDN